MLLLAACLMAFAASPRKQLLKRLKALEKQGVMIGHQDDPFYGAKWHYEEGRSDVRETTGSYPAIMGFDLGFLELDSVRNLDGVPFQSIRQEMILQHQRGGIVEISWHPFNPVNMKDAWTPTKNAIHEVLNDSRLRAVFESWVGKVADFISSLSDKDGRRVPVIFRPWHEMCGAWFWWGRDGGTQDEYKALYRLTHDILTKQRGLDNIVWAFSPNGTQPVANPYEAFYPGDDVVDIIGVDQYDFSGDAAAYTKSVNNELSLARKAAKRHGKLLCFAETGQQQLPNKQWFTQVLLPILKQNRPMSYVLLWRNAWDKPKEYYVPYKGAPSEADFVKFFEDPVTLFQKDIAKRR